MVEVEGVEAGACAEEACERAIGEGAARVQAEGAHPAADARQHEAHQAVQDATLTLHLGAQS